MVKGVKSTGMVGEIMVKGHQKFFVQLVGQIVAYVGSMQSNCPPPPPCVAY